MGQQALHFLEPELAPGEQMRWSGTPSLSTILLKAALPSVFGIVFSVVAVRSAITASMDENNAELVSATFGLIIGIYFVYSSIVAVCNAGKTAYAVTDRRILIVSWRFGTRVHSIDPRWINILEHKVRADGRGSVFCRIDHDNGSEASVTRKSGFEGISDVLGAVLALNQLRSHASGNKLRGEGDDCPLPGAGQRPALLLPKRRILLQRRHLPRNRTALVLQKARDRRA